jgi:hypothetical protein
MSLLFPKPAKPVRGTKEAKDWMGKVARLGCVVCNRQPVIVHHCIHGRFSQRKASDLDTIPLCPRCHDELHARPAMWRALNGPDHGFLPYVKQQIALMG